VSRPQWDAHVVPAAATALIKSSEPYRSRITKQYKSLFEPCRALTYGPRKLNLQRWRRPSAALVIFAATKTRDGYQAAKPYAKPVWNRIKAGVKQLLLFVRKQRILFVDPHVARIWEKVKELSSGKLGRK